MHLVWSLVIFACVSATHVKGADLDELRRPNIVLIMCDDMGFSDLGCYGGEIDTPNLDRLAAQGLRFRTFYNNAKCEHTRASLLTGRWWHHVGASATAHYKAPTLGERLRQAGYRTLMVGKWHAGQTPYERGFDHYYGLTDGCCNYWNPGHARPGEPEPAMKRVRRWAIDDREFLPFTPDRKDFYTTDAFTDHAITYLKEGRDDERPFLLYVAYTAPHYPLHASESDVAKYRGKYGAIGWDALREQRYARQRQLGVLPPNAKLSPRDPDLPAWESIADTERDQWDLRMATYAAMIDRMDRNLGRLFAQISDQGDADNTVVLFLSDNGACEDSADRSTTAGAMPWEVTSYLTQGRVWANASNTPYRKYKTTDYEGGTRTPLIAYWHGHTHAGEMTDVVGHIIDIVPTVLQLAHAEAMDQPAGCSLASALCGELIERSWPIYWQFGESRAIRDRDWKLVKQAENDWELYNVATDPTELVNVAGEQPEVVKRLVAAWQDWWGDYDTGNQ